MVRYLTEVNPTSTSYVRVRSSKMQRSIADKIYSCKS